MSYGLPAIKYKNRPLLGFRASKNHLSVFPFAQRRSKRGAMSGSGRPVERNGPLHTQKPIHDAALKRLLDHRLREIEGDK